MVEQTADIPASDVGQPGIAGLVVEDRLAVLPQALVAVHARTVVAEDRLWHERDGLAVGPRDALDDVLEIHQVIGGSEQGVESEVDLRLPRRAYLVVLHLDIDAGRQELLDDLRTKVRQMVHRRDGEIATLVARLIGEVAARLVASGVPRGLDRVDVVVT